MAPRPSRREIRNGTEDSCGVSPLRKADGAIEVDTSTLTVGQQVDAILGVEKFKVIVNHWNKDQLTPCSVRFMVDDFHGAAGHGRLNRSPQPGTIRKENQWQHATNRGTRGECPSNNRTTGGPGRIRTTAAPRRQQDVVLRNRRAEYSEQEHSELEQLYNQSFDDPEDRLSRAGLSLSPTTGSPSTSDSSPRVWSRQNS